MYTPGTDFSNNLWIVIQTNVLAQRFLIFIAGLLTQQPILKTASIGIIWSSVHLLEPSLKLHSGRE